MKNKVFVAALAIIMPPVAFLYLSRERLALTYLIVGAVVGIADLQLESAYGASGLSLVLSFVALLHSLTLVDCSEGSSTLRFYNHWWGAISIPVFVFAAVFLFRAFVLEPFSVPSSSMAPTLTPGDHVVVSKMGYGSHGTWGITLVDDDTPHSKPRAGEMFVFHAPGMDYLSIGRIVGVPGDHVSLQGTSLSINGQRVSETISDTRVSETLGDKVYTVTYLNSRRGYTNFSGAVPKGHYFVLGDNRNNSRDSRFWGFLAEGDLVGRAVFHW